MRVKLIFVALIVGILSIPTSVAAQPPFPITLQARCVNATTAELQWTVPTESGIQYYLISRNMRLFLDVPSNCPGCNLPASYTRLATAIPPEGTYFVNAPLVGNAIFVLSCPSCTVDFNASGVVDIQDIAQVSSRFMNPAIYEVRYDVSPPGSPNGVIDIADIAIVSSRFSQSCP